MKLIDRIFQDPIAFISNLRIVDKSGKRIRFGDVITPEQIELIKTLQQHKKVIVCKARQLGISTVVRAFLFWEAYTTRRTFNSAVVSNKEKSACTLLTMDKRFYAGLPKQLQRTLLTETKTELQFSMTDTRLLAMTANAEGQDRGYTLNSAHLSEFSFYNNADVYLSSLMASINNGRIVIESTPWYYGDPLHELIRTNTYDSDWKVVFFPWSTFPDYRLKPDEDFVVTEAEQSLMDTHHLDIEQICWRRKKIADYPSEALFRKEYPLTIDEGWSLDDKCYFDESELKNLTVALPTKYFDMNDAYVIGVDPAGGKGQDYSVATVLSKATYSVVDKISSNSLSINAFAKQVIDLARKYNNALIHFELNNHGHAFKEVLDFNRYTNYRDFNTTSASKITLYDNLRTQISDSLLMSVDSVTMAELRSLLKSDKGLAPKHPNGMHDDNVISLALGLDALKHCTLPTTNKQRMLNQMQRQSKPNANSIINNTFRRT